MPFRCVMWMVPSGPEAIHFGQGNLALFVWFTPEPTTVGPLNLVVPYRALYFHAGHLVHRGTGACKPPPLGKVGRDYKVEGFVRTG